MIRLIVIIIAIVALTLGLVFIAEIGGGVQLEILGYRISFSWVVASLGLALFCVIFAVTLTLLRLILFGPKALWVRRRNIRERRGYRALSKGIIAAASGDKLGAQKAARDATALLRNEPLVHLLNANVASLVDNDVAFKRLHQTMLDDERTRVLGLKGLFLDARSAGEDGKARTYAEEALALNPGAHWAFSDLFDLACRESRWRDAADFLDRQWASKLVSSVDYRRRRTVLLTAMTIDPKTNTSERAIDYANEAFRLSPDFAPAAAALAKLTMRRGEQEKAIKVLRKAWSHKKHPLILATFIEIKGGSVSEQLNALHIFIGKDRSVNEDTRIFLASLAIEAGRWVKAEDWLRPLTDQPTEKVAVMMSRIEELGHKNRDKAREWLARAVKSRPDPTWVSGAYRSKSWRPFDPAGCFDGFEWRKPETRSTSATVLNAIEHELSVALPQAPVASNETKVPHNSSDLASNDHQLNPEAVFLSEHDLPSPPDVPTSPELDNDADSIKPKL